jgi:hypothetical protein
MQWQWENATAGAVAGFTTVAALHPLDVVRTRFQGISTVHIYIYIVVSYSHSFIYIYIYIYIFFWLCLTLIP